MQEKLSVRKVYRNAYKYVVGHFGAFLFLTIFYYFGTLLPMFFGGIVLKLVSLIYFYLFFYFAAGCYYKQQILWDKKIFFAAGIRFLAAIVFLITAIVMFSVALNATIYFFKLSFPNNAPEFFDTIKESTAWLICRYAFIFFLFCTFFIVPSFAFVSEITGKNRSLLTTFAKTRGNLLKIALTAMGALVLLTVMLTLMSFVPVQIAGIVFAMLMVFVAILYFKMYDFFYNPTVSKNKNKRKNTEEIMLANTAEK